jgi:hypothetical protein
LKQAITVEGLDPLTIEDVGFASRDTLDGMSADQTALKAAQFQNFEERDPVDTGAFHGDGHNAVLIEPVSDGMQINGIGAKRANDLGIVFGWDTAPDFVGADIDTGSMRLNTVHTAKRL